MKKYIALTALALSLASPAQAESVNDTHIKRTMTAVEKAAIQQGFIKLKPGEASALTMNNNAMSVQPMMGLPPVAMEAPMPMLEVQKPSVITGNHTVLMMAPRPLPADAALIVPATTNARPSLVTQNLPYGLVMDGPGTDAYKKKKRRQKQAEIKKTEPAPVARPVSHKPAPAPVEEPAMMMRKEPTAMPDHNSLPPADEPMPEMGMPEAQDELMPPDDPFGDIGR